MLPQIQKIRRLATQLVSLFILSFFVQVPALAMETKVGDLVIENPAARATASGAKVGAGYLTITNKGSSTDRLIGGQAAFAGKVEVHTMKMVDNVMQMQPLADGIYIKPGETVILKPGGMHLMFMKLTEALEEGKHKTVTLTFEKAGSVDIMLPVLSIAETMEMKDGKKKHSHNHSHNH